MNYKKILRRIKQSVSVLMVLVLSGLNGLSAFAEDEVKFLDYGIIEYVDEEGSVIREYDSAKWSRTYLRSQSDYLWVKEMLLSMGMRTEVVESFSNEELEKYSKIKTMTSVCAYYKYDDEDNVIKVSAEDVENNIQKNARSSEEEFEGNYRDDHISVWHFSSVSEDGNTIINTTIANWNKMPTYRYTDSIGSLTQFSAVRYGTMHGHYAYYTVSELASAGERVQVDFIGTDENGNFTSETDFQSLQEGTLSGVGVTFPLPDKVKDDLGYIVSDAEDFYVYLTYEASPINLTQGEEINVYASYCHTVWRVGWDGSLSINGDFSITPSFSWVKQIKPINLLIVV